MNISIRKASLNDAETIYSIESECFSSPWSKQSISDLISSDTGGVLCAVYENTIVGYIGYLIMYDSVHIVNVAVKKSFRRKKIASTLLRRIKEIFKDSGYEGITLEVSAFNIAAISLYKKHGFVAEGKGANYYSFGEDAYIMWLRLNNE